MLDAAIKAFADLLTPPLRAVLVKSVLLALAIIAAIGIALQRLLSALADTGTAWAEHSTGFAPHSAWAARFGILILFVANAYLLGRNFFELAAMRFYPAWEAKLLRRRHAAYVFLGGMLIALFVSVPVLNLATPIFAMALMVRLHKRVAGSRIELIEALR